MMGASSHFRQPDFLNKKDNGDILNNDESSLEPSTSVSINQFIDSVRVGIGFVEGKINLEGEDSSSENERSPDGVPNSNISCTTSNVVEGESTSSSYDQLLPSMEKCIEILEPHLAAYRELCDETSNNKEIPASLLRLARFFQSRWKPIKKALLRPATDNELEVGSVYRLHLVQALQKKGLVVIEEEELLVFMESFQKMDNNSKKSPRTICERIDHLLLYKIPRMMTTSSGKQMIWQLKSFLREYHRATSTTSTTTTTTTTNQTSSSSFVELSPRDVAQRVMNCFLSIVLMNGIEGSGSGNEFEWYLVKAIFPSMNVVANDCLSCSDDIQLLTKENTAAGQEEMAVGKAVTDLLIEWMSPPFIDKLTNIQILVISRWLSYFSSVEYCTNVYLKAPFLKCCANCNQGFAALPRIIATYCSLKKSSNAKESNVSSRVYAIIKSNISNDDPRAIQFVDFIFQGVHLLLSSKSQ